MFESCFARPVLFAFSFSFPFRVREDFHRFRFPLHRRRSGIEEIFSFSFSSVEMSIDDGNLIRED